MCLNALLWVSWFLSSICYFPFGYSILLWSIWPVNWFNKILFFCPPTIHREVRSVRIVPYTWYPDQELLKWAHREVKLESAHILPNYQFTWKLVKADCFFQNPVSCWSHRVRQWREKFPTFGCGSRTILEIKDSYLCDKSVSPVKQS